MKVTAFRHTTSDGLGTFEKIMQSRNIPYHCVDVYKEDIAHFDALEPEFLMIMGGAPGVYQDNDYPFLKHEMDIIKKRAEKDLPTLGVCLGSQLIARALGGKVYQGDVGFERGWFPLQITNDGEKTPVRHFGDCKAVLHWHRDTFDLPQGAKRLASSERYKNQAFVYGRNIWALQFHSEMNPTSYQEWCVKSAHAFASGDLKMEEMRAQADEFLPRMMAQTEKFLLELLEHFKSQ